jgi:hypothetical protein
MEIPVSQAGYSDMLTLEIGFTQFHHTKLKICIKVSKGANNTTLFIIYSTLIQKSYDLCHLKAIDLSYS